MTRRSKPPEGKELRASPEDTGGPTLSTRRKFLASAGKKAAFIVPVVTSLTAQEALAAGSYGCSPYGAPCVVDEDCCDLNCHVPTMTCKGPI